MTVGVFGFSPAELGELRGLVDSETYFWRIDEPAALPSIDLMVIDLDSLSPAEEPTEVLNEVGIRSGGVAQAIVSASPTALDLALTAQHVMHLVSRDQSPVCLQLAAIIGRMRHPTPGLRAAVNDLSAQQQPPMRVIDRKSKQSTLDELTRLICEQQVPARHRINLINAVDELLSNALRFGESDTGATERISIEIGHTFCPGGISIRVSDNRGRLTPERFKQALTHGRDCHVRKQIVGEGGLGLYAVLMALSELDVTITSGVKTEFVGRSLHTLPYRDFRRRSKSFSIVTH